MLPVLGFDLVCSRMRLHMVIWELVSPGGRGEGQNDRCSIIVRHILVEQSKHISHMLSRRPSSEYISWTSAYMFYQLKIPLTMKFNAITVISTLLVAVSAFPAGDHLESRQIVGTSMSFMVLVFTGWELIKIVRPVSSRTRKMHELVRVHRQLSDYLHRNMLVQRQYNRCGTNPGY
jgi:hypothetical protein